ncbi:phosphoheptose isomerase [Candidatus Pelagibacter sp.]|jgi:hypothetical protein|nr:phosphoheptose isomerase [Candidatus Pelagibacter sp.]
MENKKKILCFDLDNTLCLTIGNDYKNAKPIKKNIKFVNYLYKKDYYIKIFTARFMGRSKENINLAKKKGLKLTQNQIKKWGLNCHELIMGKPTYDLFVDDKAVFFNKNWPQEIKKILSK